MASGRAITVSATNDVQHLFGAGRDLLLAALLLAIHDGAPCDREGDRGSEEEDEGIVIESKQFIF